MTHPNEGNPVMLTTTQRTTKACPIERTIHVERTDALRATVTETRPLKTKTTSSSRTYRLQRFAADFGTAAEVANTTTGECYRTNVDGWRYECDCPAGAYSSKPCVHVE